MARPTLFTHPKFRRLVYLLQVPVPHAVGYLECIWHVAYDSGNAVLGDAVDVELAAQWPGEPGKLCEALAQVGFLDRHEDGRFAVHDLWHHAPEYVRKRMQREEGRKHRYTPRNRPLTAGWRDTATLPGDELGGPNAELGGQCPPNGAYLPNKAELGQTPAPAPTPNTPLTPLGGDEGDVSQNKKQPPKRRRGKQPANPAIPQALDTPEFRAAWGRWEVYRAERRQSLTDSTRESQLRKLAGLGPATAIATIEQSIEQGWQGLFPERVRARGGTAAGAASPSREELIRQAEQRSREIAEAKARAMEEYRPLGRKAGGETR